MVAATFENTLPYTVGDKAGYRTDGEGNRFTSTDFKNIASKIGDKFKLRTPIPSGQDYLDWVKGYNDVATTGSIQTWSNETIEGVNTGGFIGNIANQIIKNKHGLG